jgi:phage terminase small subunit
MKRGRKSAAEHATKPILAFTRKLPDPPAGLTAREAETWKTVVASPAGAMIDASNFALLAQFCREVALADIVAELVHEFRPDWVRTDGGLERLDRLLRMQERCSRTVASLSGKLCLSPSARVHKDSAGRLVANQSDPGRPLPWDSDGRE